MKLLALPLLVILPLVGGCDDTNPGNPVDAKGKGKEEIAGQLGPEEVSTPSVAEKKTRQEVLIERFGEDDPTTFAVDEPKGVLFGSDLE